MNQLTKDQNITLCKLINEGHAEVNIFSEERHPNGDGAEGFDSFNSVKSLALTLDVLKADQ